MVLYRPPKRARITGQRFELERFGGGGYPAAFSGPFRDNIREFLRDFGQAVAPPGAVAGIGRWSVPLLDSRRCEQWLDVIVEAPFVSGALDCCHCRIVGWKHHPVCGARYHFILHSSEKLKALRVGKGHKLCSHCGSVIASSFARCPRCGLSSSRTIVVENTSHLLHGVLHSNGYGHLLRVNGREGGSTSLTGREIMDLWDRFCTMLRAREVSVLDASKKFGTSFRLLHAVAKGQSWYGLWGYQFGRGTFGTTYDAYRKAVSQIGSTSLDFLLDLGDERLSRIATRYQKGGNLQELVNRMLELLHVHRKVTSPEADVNLPLPTATTTPSRSSKRWSTQRLDKALDVLLTALRKFGLNEWMPRAKLREQARLHIGDTGLLDHSLCSCVGKVVGDLVVERRRDERRQLEYRLANVAFLNENEKVKDGDKTAYTEILNDLQYLHNQVLAGGLLPGNHPLAQASRTVLDTKHFIKDYNFEKSEIDEHLWVECRMQSVDSTGGVAPSEPVLLPRDCTVGDLKREAVKAFKDVYPGFAQMQVTTVPVVEDESDERPLKLQRVTPGVVTLKATGIGQSPLAGGTDVWVVNCRCGARDDDGERMAACDACGVWSHTRCSQIQDGDEVPEKFFCQLCWKP